MEFRRVVTAGSAGWRADWGVTVGWVRRGHVVGAGPAPAPAPAPRPVHTGGLAGPPRSSLVAVCGPTRLCSPAVLLRLSRRLYTTDSSDGIADADEVAASSTVAARMANHQKIDVGAADRTSDETNTPAAYAAAETAVPRAPRLTPANQVGLIAAPIQPESPKLLKVAVVGLPNVGKSTLMNRLVGRKVSIVSPKVQTTRERMLGITTIGDVQTLYFDTPGVVSYSSGRKLKTPRTLITESRNSMLEADVVITMVDGRGFAKAKEGENGTAQLWVPKENGKAQLWVPRDEIDQSTKHILVINKMDRLRGVRARQFLTDLYLDAARGPTDDDPDQPFFSDIFEVSALRGKGVPMLEEYLSHQAVDADWLYPSELATDQSMLKIVEEAVREQLFHRLRAELPYLLFQKNDSHTLNPDGVLVVTQTIFVRNRAQLKIVVGVRGNTINLMTAGAEAALGMALDRKIHLKVRVKVASKKEWELRGLVPA